MFKRKEDRIDGDAGTIDGGHDELPPTGNRNDEEDFEITDRDFGWEEGDAADRRRDPLRK